MLARLECSPDVHVPNRRHPIYIYIPRAPNSLASRSTPYEAGWLAGWQELVVFVLNGAEYHLSYSGFWCLKVSLGLHPGTTTHAP